MGINHSDIKPQNIMWDVDENGHVYPRLCDFDLASFIGKSGMISSYYGEMILKEDSLETPFTDVFAFVISCAEIIFGDSFDPFLKSHEEILTEKFDRMIDLHFIDYVLENPTKDRGEKYEAAIYLLKTIVVFAQTSNIANHQKLTTDRAFRRKLELRKLNDPEIQDFYQNELLSLKLIEKYFSFLLDMMRS